MFERINDEVGEPVEEPSEGFITGLANAVAATVETRPWRFRELTQQEAITALEARQDRIEELEATRLPMGTTPVTCGAKIITGMNELRCERERGHRGKHFSYGRSW